MVFAAPLFLASQTRAMREFAVMNREPLLRLGLGTVSAYLCLLLLSKSVRERRVHTLPPTNALSSPPLPLPVSPQYESNKLVEEVQIHVRRQEAVAAALRDSAWLTRTAAAVVGAGAPSSSSSSAAAAAAAAPGAAAALSAQAALRAEIEAALATAYAVAEEGNQAALAASGRFPDLRMPHAAGLETARARGKAIAAEAEAGAAAARAARKEEGEGKGGQGAAAPRRSLI